MEEGNELQPAILSLYTKVAGNYKLKGDMVNAISYTTKVYMMMKEMMGKENEQTNIALKNIG